MALRFSLKWLLAAMAYVAIAAAAFKDGWWIWADLLWAIAWLAGAYALLNFWLRDGAARAGAAGFAIVMACYGLSLQFAPGSLPTARMLMAVGVDATSVASPTFIPVYPYPAPNVNAAVTTAITARNTDLWAPKLRAAHCFAAMLAGLAGYSLGLLAWRQARPKAVSTPAVSDP